MKHEFTLVLGGINQLNDDIVDALYESGCDDGTISQRDRVVRVRFARSAPTREEAITSAIRNVEAAGLGAGVVRVEHAGSDPIVGAVNSVLALPEVIRLNPSLQNWVIDRVQHVR
jgi:hypothetical protein